MENPILQRQSLTVLQQIEELKNWHKQQQSKLDTENITESEHKHQQKVEHTIAPYPKKENNILTQKNFDEIEIKVTNPNFKELIENNIPLNENQSVKTQQNGKTNKFKFLRRGEGTARFRMGHQNISKNKGRSNRTLCLSNAFQKPNIEPNNAGQRLAAEKTLINENEIPTLNPPDLKLDVKNWKAIFNSEKAEEIIEKIINNSNLELFQPDSSIDSSTASIMEKFITFGRKHLKEKEELRVFEAIEQHVLDSSFCSDSSYVSKLMEKAVISTPLKNLPINNKTINTIAQNNKLSTVLLGNDRRGITISKNTDCVSLDTPIWINHEEIRVRGDKSIEPTENKDLEQSLHVRFAEDVDYKSFVEYSESASNDLQAKVQNSVEDFNGSREWKEESREDSVCCSECSTSYSSSSDDVRAISPPGRLPPIMNSTADNSKLLTNVQSYRSSVEKLEMADLETQDRYSQGNKILTTNVTETVPLILDKKIKELEDEIEVFRAENQKLKTLRESLEKERKQFQQEKRKLLKEIEEDKNKCAVQLDEEKQKLAKDKLVFEKYSKSLSKHTTREERREIQALRDQLSEMKEELNKKESRWGAAQARVRNQVKLLEEDNKKLREEVEILRKQSKNLEILTQKRKGKQPNNTKLIHAISDYISNTPVEEQGLIKISSGCGYFASKDNPVRTSVSVVNEVDPKSVNTVRVVKENVQEEVKGRSNNNTVVNESNALTEHSHTTKTVCDYKYKNQVSHQETFSKASVETLANSPKETFTEDGSVEKVYPDGRKEIRYKNGNVKKVDPFTESEKTIYFNGDVKEIMKDRTVKYYFSESRIWHTTLPDGLEMLDFPNGQVEKRHTNGLVEIIYPNDCKKLTYPDGCEEIYYNNGTKLRIEADKRKVLMLPNGQKEIQTDECIRREYPDGTVKIVYPDGVTETVYSSGRVRLKDKHGNLVMDSATSANRLS